MEDDRLGTLFVIFAVLAILSAMLYILVTMEESQPEGDLAELELEVEDVVLAEAIYWNFSSAPLRVKNSTIIALKVNVSNGGDDPVGTNRLRFQVVTDRGNITYSYPLDVFDPRLDGGPFSEYRTKVRPGSYKVGWIAHIVGNASLNWTEATLRLVIIPERQPGASTRFSIADAPFLPGVPPRINFEVNDILVTDRVGDLAAGRGDYLYVFNLTVHNTWNRPVTMDPWQLWVEYSGPTWRVHATTGVDGLERPFARLKVQPGESVVCQAVFEVPHHGTVDNITYHDMYTYGVEGTYVVRTVDPGMVRLWFSAPRVTLQVDSMRWVERVDRLTCGEDEVFLILHTKINMVSTGSLHVDYTDLTLTDDAGRVYPVDDLITALYPRMPEGNVSYGSTRSGDVLFRMPLGADPALLTFNDSGQLATLGLDPEEVVDARGETRLRIVVMDLTFTDRTEQRMAFEGKYFLLVRLKVTNAWSIYVYFELNNLTLYDADGSMTSDDPCIWWIDDPIRGGVRLMRGEWVSGTFWMEVPQDWEPGRLVYSDHVHDIVVDLTGMEVDLVISPPELELELHWHALTEWLDWEGPADPGFLFLVTNFTVRYIGPDELFLHFSAMSALNASGGYNYELAWMFIGEYFPIVRLDPNESATGMIGFLVPEWDIPTSIEYRYKKDYEVAIDPGTIREVDIGSERRLTINDIYWTDSIGPVNPYYSDRFLVVNFTFHNGWFEPIAPRDTRFAVVEDNGWEDEYDRRSDGSLKDRWAEPMLAMGQSASGQLSFDLQGGGQPVRFRFEDVYYNLSVPIDPGAIRNGTRGAAGTSFHSLSGGESVGEHGPRDGAPLPGTFPAAQPAPRGGSLIMSPYHDREARASRPDNYYIHRPS